MDGPGAVPPEHDDRAAGYSWEGLWIVCAGAAGGGAVCGVSSGAAARRLSRLRTRALRRNWGVNLVRAVGAAYRDLHSDERAQGASTMTMQLARNLFLSSEKTYGRKLQEIFLSMQIERRFTKQQIFELYANQIYLGRGTYGFEAGSEYYFSKHARDLTLPEAALLAALPKGPEYLFAGAVSGARAEAAQSGAQRDAAGRQDYAGSRRRRRRLRRWDCIWSRRRTAWLRTLWKRCGGSWRRSTASKRCMARGCACIRRWILDLQQVANKAVLDGTATYERRHGWKGKSAECCARGDGSGELSSIRTGRSRSTKGSYVHGLVTEVSAKKVVVKLGDAAGGDDAGGLDVDAECGWRQLFAEWRYRLCAD